MSRGDTLLSETHCKLRRSAAVGYYVGPASQNPYIILNQLPFVGAWLRRGRRSLLRLPFICCARLHMSSYLKTCSSCLLVKKTWLHVHHANIVQRVKSCYKIKINSRESKSCFYGFLQHKSHPRRPSKNHSALIAPLLQSKSATITTQ